MYVQLTRKRPTPYRKHPRAAERRPDCQQHISPPGNAGLLTMSVDYIPLSCAANLHAVKDLAGDHGPNYFSQWEPSSALGILGLAITRTFLADICKWPTKGGKRGWQEIVDGDYSRQPSSLQFILSPLVQVFGSVVCCYLRREFLIDFHGRPLINISIAVLRLQYDQRIWSTEYESNPWEVRCVKSTHPTKSQTNNH